MTRHLKAEELVDVLESRAATRAWVHVERCAECRARVDVLTEMRRAVAEIDAPQPSPLFWSHLSARIHEAVEGERRPAGAPWRWPLRFAVPAVAMAAAVALLVASLTVLGTRTQTPPMESMESMGSMTRLAEFAAMLEETDVPIETQNADPAWELVMAVAEDAQWDDLSAEGLVRPGTADLGLLQLSAEERLELARLLNEELKKTEAS